MGGALTGEEPPPTPRPRLSVGFVGHGPTHVSLSGQEPAAAAAIGTLFDTIAGSVPAGAPSVRLVALLADGSARLALERAVGLGWERDIILPFGRDLHRAIASLASTLEDGERLLAGAIPGDHETARRAAALEAAGAGANRLVLADQDAAVARGLRAGLTSGRSSTAWERFRTLRERRVSLASRILVEQADLLVAFWDGRAGAGAGSTHHTVEVALDLGTPVLWVDAAAPGCWRLLVSPESLAGAREAAPVLDRGKVEALIRDLVPWSADRSGFPALAAERWHPSSNPIWHGYRRVEALFGDDRPLRPLTQHYEPPSAIAAGSGAPLLAVASSLAGDDPEFVARLDPLVLRRFAWSDAISARLSDAYRGGMTVNFLLSAIAVISGISYQVFATVADKWAFAIVEFLLLSTIITVTSIGIARRWHARWFQTRRVAEYLRHAPLLLLLGVARPRGRWPRGGDTAWPEDYSRAALIEVGLPRVEITTGYLRRALAELIDRHVTTQRDYHRWKAKRLSMVHHRLDRISGRLFQAAVIAVAIYLVIAALAAIGAIAPATPIAVSKLFTWLGVALPTLGAAIAGIRYFGDFERFAAISEVTAEKLDAVHERAALLLAAPESALDHGRVAELARAADQIVFAEIENWQAVFGGKQIAVPV